MVLVTINKVQRLLHLSFIADVQAEELRRVREEAEVLLADLKPGFRLLTDLDRMHAIGMDCTSEIGQMMELLDEKGVEMIVRVIPDPTKDIGLNILSLFHYPNRPRMVTCEDMVEAARLLSL